MYSRRLKKSLFSPAQPRRAETRLSPGVVLALFRPSTYKRRFSEVGVAVGVFPFAKTYSRGERPTRSAVCTSSAIHSLRPCWTAFLSLLLSLQAGCITVNLIEPSGPVQEVQLSGTGAGKILLLDLSGVISSQDKDGIVPQPNMLATFKEELTRASKDDKIKAVVVRINSPGGTVTASDILYHELRDFKTKKKVPVIVSMMDVAASGGYYLAMAADSILVHPSTVTGSIGVIMLTVNARGLLEKVGVEANAITSGPRKDMGSPFRVMTPEERGIFQGVIDSFYLRFLAVVQEGRPNLSADQIKKLADGRIYSGDQAKAAGLIDEIGYLDDALEMAKKKAGLTEARVVTYGRRGEYQNNIYSRLFGTSSGITGLANLDLLSMVRGGTPQFMYLWMP
jgi:protease-4